MRLGLRHCITLGSLTATLLTIAVGFNVLSTKAADHLDAPGLTSPNGELLTDLNDVYAFVPSGKPNRTALIMTSNPAAGVFGPAGFDPHASYIFNIDTNGDANRDVVYRVLFGPTRADGSQNFRLFSKRLHADTVETRGRTGRTSKINGGPGRITAGTYDDPFFFDLDAFLGTGGRAFCDGGEADFFPGLNVNAIVIQVPRKTFDARDIGVWASTRKDGEQIDRAGRPGINTVFVPSGSKDAYNAAMPRDDRELFGDFVNATFLAGGNDQATADALTDILLPDILTFNTRNMSGFLNGRRMPDDVIDAALGLILVAGGPTSDCVDANDVAFRDAFPFLAPAH